MNGLSSALGDLLPAALGVAVSPLPIIAAILMLLSRRASATAPAFAVGWVLGLAAVTVLLLALAGPNGADTGGSSTTSSWIKLVLGVLFLALGARTWSTRPREGEPATPPSWMAGLDTIRPVAAFGLGALLAGLNPKNLALSASASVAIASADLSSTQTTVCVVVFVVLGSLLVVGPVVGYFVARQAMTAPLTSTKAFMQEQNAVIMTVLLALLGVSNLGKGLGGLLG